MDIKQLNEAISKVLNELNDETIEKVGKIRLQNRNKAYSDHRVNPDNTTYKNLKNAQNKLDKFSTLNDKRYSRMNPQEVIDFSALREEKLEDFKKYIEETIEEDMTADDLFEYMWGTGDCALFFNTAEGFSFGISPAVSGHYPFDYINKEQGINIINDILNQL